MSIAFTSSFCSFCTLIITTGIVHADEDHRDDNFDIIGGFNDEDVAASRSVVVGKSKVVGRLQAEVRSFTYHSS